MNVLEWNLVEAALAWWRTKRPEDYDQADHIRNPIVNTSSDEEAALARVVALYVASEVRVGARGSDGKDS